MDVTEKKDNVYELITALCEHTLKLNDKSVDKLAIKKLRSNAYGIVLKKSYPKITSAEYVKCLGDYNDPYCELASWQYMLNHQFGKKEESKKLQKCVSSLEEFSSLDKTVLDAILTVLLQLKQVPKDDELSLGIHKTDSSFRIFNENNFKIPAKLSTFCSKFSNDSFILQHKRKPSKFPSLLDCKFNPDSFKSLLNTPSKNTNDTSADIANELTKSLQPQSSLNIWDIAASTKYTTRRTWESMGDPTPNIEKPFLSEATSEISSLVIDLKNLYYNSHNALIPPNKISYNQFVSDIKNILVGISSNTFKYDPNGNAFLQTNITVEGLAKTSLQSYCEDIIFCANCYRALNDISTRDKFTGFYKQTGYIFAEFCASIQRYLSFYRLAAQLPSVATSGAVRIHAHARRLRGPLRALATVCCVGPFAETPDINTNPPETSPMAHDDARSALPHGVALLDHLYEYAPNFPDHDASMVLYAVLYSCLQVYLCRFLRQWIMEGNVFDPYNEFFISLNHKYVSSRTRTYWTRSFTINEAIVPNFLSKWSNEIYNCGRIMNLLKLCNQKSPICSYIADQKPELIRCCFTADQLHQFEENISYYYLSALAETGPKFSLQNYLSRCRTEEQIFLNLVASKRAATLRRIEVEKLKKLEELAEKKREEMKTMREQYENALKEKEDNMNAEKEAELKLSESQLRMKMLEEKIIKEEAADMVKYYNKLFAESDRRRQAIEKHIDTLKNVSVNWDCQENLDLSSSTYFDVPESMTSPNPCEASPKEHEDDRTEAISSDLDLLNANIADNYAEAVEERVNGNHDSATKPESVAETSEVARMAADNFETARRNKRRVLNQELGFGFSEIQKPREVRVNDSNMNLTEAQKNKLKVMSSEFGLDLTMKFNVVKSEPTVVEINRTRGNRSNGGLYHKTTAKYDNENYLNSNNCDSVESFVSIGDATSIKPDLITSKISSLDVNIPVPSKKSLKLDLPKAISSFAQYMRSPNFEFFKPMSVDSTPMTDYSPNVTKPPIKEIIDVPSPHIALPFAQGCRQVTAYEANQVKMNSINYFVQQSVILAVSLQGDLVEAELLKHFVLDLGYLKHLNTLRSYFFLMDGEFGRHISDGLFERLYKAETAKDLINCRTLKHLLFTATDLGKSDENSKYLSFELPNETPQMFDLRDPNVLNCLSLSYKVAWPLNILLPIDTITKYDEIFKFLLKVRRVSWVLKKMFLDMKLLSKSCGKREPYLLMSPQFQKLHQCRHIMTHFVQTLQNYVVGEVLQNSWAQLNDNLTGVKNIDELYVLHTTYIKNIIFKCLLSQKSAPIRQVINNIFIVIFKFYDYLRSRRWEFVEDAYMHPNFRKLEGIFHNFMEFVQFLCKAVPKVSKSGYQPQLVQLVDMLDINMFFVKNNEQSSTSNA